MNIRIMTFAFVVSNGFLIGALQPAQSQDPGLINVFQDWSAFVRTEGGEKQCFIGSVPVKEEGKYKQRGDVRAVIAHRPGEGTFGVVSFKAGYTFKGGSEASVTIGGRVFKLFTKTSHAWAYNDADDRALVAAMRAGATMIVKGRSARGTQTTDTYSLKGFTAAYRAIGKACGVKGK